jgi:hypothetical protein
LKIYLAARYSRCYEMREVAKFLSDAGHAVVSRWINGGHEISKEGSTQAHFLERRIFALDDYADLISCDCCVSFTEEPKTTLTRGGRHVEFGIALALNKVCIVIGPAENVFHCLPNVIILDSHFKILNTLEGR